MNGNIEIGNKSNALAFVMDFGSDPENRDAPPVTTGHRKAVCVYRNVDNESSINYKEIPEAELAVKFGKTSLKELLEPGKLKLVFGN